MKLIALLLLSVLLTSAADADQDTVERYLELTQSGKAPSLDRLRGFIDVFSELDGEMLEQRINQAYAEKLYFNDTFITLDNRTALVKYLRATANKANFVNTTILDVAHSGDDVYVKWLLEMEFDLMGRPRFSRTAGMSHLRFDSESKIVLQQDFWDSAGGFYRHLPVVGRLISWIQKRLHQ